MRLKFILFATTIIRFMRFTLTCAAIFCMMLTGCKSVFQNYNETIDLSGTWKFQLDSANVGIQEKWFNTALNDSLKLPGTTDENKKGIFLDEKAVDRLSRVWYWKGAAWYQKEVTTLDIKTSSFFSFAF